MKLEKRCPTCKIVKSITEFHKDKQQASGLKPYCKLCGGIRRKDYVKRNKDKVRRYQSQYYQTNKMKVNKRVDSYRKANPAPHSAHRAVWYAVKSGRLQKFPCEICGESKVEGHHYKGYDKAFYLTVKWLCIKHHKEVHYG